MRPATRPHSGHGYNRRPVVYPLLVIHDDVADHDGHACCRCGPELVSILSGTRVRLTPKEAR